MSAITDVLGLFFFAFVYCVLLVIQKHNCFPEFFNGLMGVYSFPNGIRFMPHQEINTDLVCSSTVKFASEGMAAFMGCVINSDGLKKLFTVFEINTLR